MLPTKDSDSFGVFVAAVMNGYFGANR
jgi:hypothetical protein